VYRDLKIEKAGASLRRLKTKNVLSAQAAFGSESSALAGAGPHTYALKTVGCGAHCIPEMTMPTGSCGTLATVPFIYLVLQRLDSKLGRAT
jgi:hypothetical protein